MGQLTLEKKIAQLPDIMKLKLEEYVDAMMSEEKKLHTSTPNQHRQFGGGKNIFGKISPDFDEPLDDLKEYMSVDHSSHC